MLIKHEGKCGGPGGEHLMNSWEPRPAQPPRQNVLRSKVGNVKWVNTERERWGLEKLDLGTEDNMHNDIPRIITLWQRGRAGGVMTKPEEGRQIQMSPRDGAGGKNADSK